MAIVFVPRERQEGETRVAATPETIRQMVQAGLGVLVERGAGARANFRDEDYLAAGGEIVDEVAAQRADLVLGVGPPRPQGEILLRRGAVWVGFLSALHHLEETKAFASGGVTSLSMDRVPRITKAQSMDALSSQANLAGYKAVLLGASRLDKYFPLLMTAAGTVHPARVVIMGAGVAGLQAIATARRLGAVVEVSDIRPAVKEQVLSLGGRFIDLPQVEGGEGEGGYAKELSAEALEKQQAIIADHVAAADVVITTALIPGRRAPLLVTRAMVERMRPGAVVVDLAASHGGNCEPTCRDEEVRVGDVLILGPSNLPATVPADASTLYARNVWAVVRHLMTDGKLHLDPDDVIAGAMMVTKDGTVLQGPGAVKREGAEAC